jgi:hypothetical protein
MLLSLPLIIISGENNRTNQSGDEKEKRKTGETGELC